MENIKLKSFLLGFLTYAPTLILLPQSIIYIIISFIGFVMFITDLKSMNLFKQDAFLILFLLLTSLVYYILGPVSNTATRSINEFVPYTVFFVTMIFYARHLNSKVLYVILCFICLETLVGIGEYLMGRPYIIKPTVTGETEFGESTLLYYNRVYGLSQAVSIYAYKVFIGIILLFYLEIKKYKYFILALLMVGLFISFNRTAIIGSIVFLILFFLKSYASLKVKYKVALLVILFIIIYVVNIYLDTILFQFFRGKEGDLSGRDRIFTYFVSFIENNLLLGNNSHKLWSNIGGSVYHAHNSYLQTFANLGLIFFVMIWIYILSFFSRKGLVYLIPILVYSSFQYGILWGVSFMDIIFFHLLFEFYKKNK